MKQETFFVVMGLFDEKTNGIFQKINKEIIQHGGPAETTTPHITFGAYTEVHEEELIAWVRQVVCNSKKIAIHFNHIGIFNPNVLFLAPHLSKELTDLHSKLHEHFDNCGGTVGYNYSLASNNWTPHATIQQADFKTICNILPTVSKVFSPFYGEIVSLRIAAFYPEKEIFTFTL